MHAALQLIAVELSWFAAFTIDQCMTWMEGAKAAPDNPKLSAIQCAYGPTTSFRPNSAEYRQLSAVQRRHRHALQGRSIRPRMSQAFFRSNGARFPPPNLGFLRQMRLRSRTTGTHTRNIDAAGARRHDLFGLISKERIE
jgi:hypothetical protein